jgi:hypothetical protein
LKTALPEALTQAKELLTALSSDPIKKGAQMVADLFQPTDNKTATLKAQAASQSIPSILSGLDAKGIVHTLLAPAQKFVDLPYNAAMNFVGADRRSDASLNKLLRDAGIDSSLLIPVSSLLSYIEALLNWAGKIPVVSILSGSLRSTLGVSVATAGTAVGVMLIAASVFGNSAKATLGKTIIKEYVVLHGAGNVARGFIESSSWILSLALTTPWDLAGKRFSYLKEQPALLHPALFLQTPKHA